LRYFYETGLGIKIDTISEAERKMLGRMYGDETMFQDTGQAPYLPFYYGDAGFRYFTTHGQWRDSANSRSIKAEDSKPGWSVGKGWQIETWQQLKFSPFFEPCFGDTVAAGVLSTFIYKTKKRLDEADYHDSRLDSILDELDLYRPTYAAIRRILHETKIMRKEEKKQKAVDIIESTLYECVMEWLDWDFTYESSSTLQSKTLKVVREILETMKSMGHGLEIKTIAFLLKIEALFNRLHQPTVKFSAMKKISQLPAAIPALWISDSW